MLRSLSASHCQFPPLRENAELLTVYKLFTQVHPDTAGCWTQGAKYRDGKRHPIDILDAAVVPTYFDLVGAVDFVYRNKEQNQTARIRLSVVLQGMRVDEWNDAKGRTIEEVLDVVRKANI